MSKSSATKKPGGRRPGDSGSRGAILRAARAQFAERGYDNASMRSIAAEAGVDPALIRHFFGDKATLFAASVTGDGGLPDRLIAVLSGDPATVGRRLTETYLGMWEDPETRPSLEALLRSAVTSQQAADLLISLVQNQLRASIDADDDRLRLIAIAAAHLHGVAYARYVMRIPPLANLSYDELVADIAPTIHRYLTGQHR